MQTAINTDNFVMTVMETLMASMDMWAEQERLNQVKAALYMNLMDKTILADDYAGRQLPTEYIDDTPRVVEMWLRCMQLEKRTAGTIENYRGELRNFFEWCRKHYADITTNDVRAYLSWRQIVKHNSDTTINNKYHALQSFYRWIMSEDLIEDGGSLARKPKKNPMDKINKVKTEKKMRTVLTDEQAEIIRCDCQTVRDRAVVEVLIATGMRVSELVGLDLNDIDIRAGKCIIYGKGRKERPAFFTPRALVHLEEYLAERRQITDCEPALFLNFRRKGGIYTRLSDDSIRHMLNAIVESDRRLSGLNLHPHMFRAYLATYMSRHGASIKDIQRILGHSNINTTSECYIIDDDESMKQVHELFAA